MSLARRMASNFAAQGFALAASLADRVLVVGAMLRNWGSAEFSDYMVLQAAAAMLFVAELGAQLYFQNAEQAAYAAGDKAAFRRLVAIHSGLMAALCAALAVVLAALAAAGGLNSLFVGNALGTSAARAAFACMAGANLLTLLRTPASTAYRATGDFTRIVVIGALALLAQSGLSAVAVVLGAGPLALSIIALSVGGVGAFVFVGRDIRARHGEWLAKPAWPSPAEASTAARHVKWYSLQIIAPAAWLQAPVLILKAGEAGGRTIATFLLLRTLVGMVRQVFQFAATGAGIEIAPYTHRGETEQAWRLSARIGLWTTGLTAATTAGVLSFGDAVVRGWTGNAALYSAPMALALLAPLLATAPLQQPFALLQFANVSAPPGVQRLLQIALTPTLCALGLWLYGALGLAVGLALAEIIAFWSMAPVLARLPSFPGFLRYGLESILVGIFVFAVDIALGLGLNWLAPATNLFTEGAKIALWGLIGVVPFAFIGLPASLRATMLNRVAPWRGARRSA